jgi:hypothetical protein
MGGVTSVSKLVKWNHQQFNSDRCLRMDKQDKPEERHRAGQEAHREVLWRWLWVVECARFGRCSVGGFGQLRGNVAID